jgi:hypothetical protein
MTLLTLNASENPSGLDSRHTWWLFVEFVRSNVPEGLRYTVAHSHDSQRSVQHTAKVNRIQSCVNSVRL